jgi:hypothetical protein
MKLSLGVVEVPYADITGQDTGEVASLLEAKYGVMQGFVDRNMDHIAGSIEDGIAGALESVLAGAPENFNVFGSAMSNIEDRFHDYIDREEHGIRTKAKDEPKAGARKKRQYRKASGKTTFVDSGLYRNNFKAWINGQD